jgi:hypothetical protein
MASVVGFAVGAYGITFDAGFAVGVPTFTLLLAVMGASSYFAYRTAQTAAMALPALGRAAGSVLHQASALLDQAGAVGLSAEGVFHEHVEPALAAVYGVAVPPRPSVAQQLRVGARTLVIITYLVVVAAALVFLYGFFQAGAVVMENSRCESVVNNPTCPGGFPSP